MWGVRRADGTVATGWALMPLRLFLGFTFLYAGLNKLANPDFLGKARPEVVEELRERQVELARRCDRLKAAYDRLAGT